MDRVRIHAIVRELNNENIDVVNYSDNPTVYLQRSLAPAKLKSVDLDETAKKVTIVVEKDQVSLVIGRNGLNIRLASRLTGYEINLIKEGVEEEYDMDLSEFRDELGEPLLERLIEEGYTTARNVIDAPAEDLLVIEGLTEEKIGEMKAMMEEELEDADIEDGDLQGHLVVSPTDTAEDVRKETDPRPPAPPEGTAGETKRESE